MLIQQGNKAFFHLKKDIDSYSVFFYIAKRPQTNTQNNIKRLKHL